MADFLLKCPECETVYKLPIDAVPEQGRKVECSTCGNEWLAFRNGANITKAAEVVGDASTDAAVTRHDPPTGAKSSSQTENTEHEKATAPDFVSPNTAPIEHRLPAEVLAILRDEVEFERQARQEPDTTQIDTALESNWPATTVTEPLKKQAKVAPDLTFPSDTQGTKMPFATDTLPPVIASPEVQKIPESKGPTAQGIERTDEARKSATPSAQHLKQADERTGRGSYRAGFGLAMIVAAATIVLYIIAPEFADKGPAGKQLMEFRHSVDAGRLWLDKQVSEIAGGP